MPIVRKSDHDDAHTELVAATRRAIGLMELPRAGMVQGTIVAIWWLRKAFLQAPGPEDPQNKDMVKMGTGGLYYAVGTARHEMVWYGRVG
eukprot:scaffold1971_cov127-Amphora_coffeaeformis.AAC.8